MRGLVSDAKIDSPAGAWTDWVVALVKASFGVPFPWGGSGPEWAY